MRISDRYEQEEEGEQEEVVGKEVREEQEKACSSHCC